MKRFGPLPVLLAAAAASPQTQQPTPSRTPSPPPISFGVEVQYVEVDAIVTDKDGNVVRDLTRDDFEIKEEGKPRPVELAALIDLPTPAPDPQKVKAVEPDVKGNLRPFEGRLYIIVLDDLHTAALRSQGVKRAARLFIEKHFGDEDLAAVVQVSGRGDAGQELTGNRRLLLSAVDKFMGQRLRSATLNKIDVYNMTRDTRDPNERIRDPDEFQRGYNARSSLDALRSVADWLGNIHGRRKAVIYISEGIDYDVHDPFNNSDASTIMSSMRDVISAATRANVSLYTVDPRGLHGMGDETMDLNPVQDTSLGLDGRGLQSEMQLAQDSLRVLADETVGRAAVASNDFAGAFDRIVKDNSSYYVLGFRPANERADGRPRKLEVRVKRPGLKVRSRNGYVLARRAARRPDPPTFVGSRAPGPLKELLQLPIQQSGLPMVVSAAAFRGKAGTNSVMVTAHFGGQAFRDTEKDGKFQDVLEVSLVAFDKSAKTKGTDSQLKLDLKPQTKKVVDAAGFRFLGQLELPPGLYQLRCVARASNASAAGSVYYDLEVPDFSKGPLTLSGLLVSSATSALIPTAGAFEQFKDVLPAPPTTFRDFLPGDTLSVVAEIYDNELKTPHTLDVTTSVVEDGGIVKFHNDQQRKTEELTSIGGGAFVHKALVPLKDLAPGTYTLRVEARSRMGKQPRVVRDVAFRVVAPPSGSQEKPGQRPRSTPS